MAFGGGAAGKLGAEAAGAIVAKVKAKLGKGGASITIEAKVPDSDAGR